MTTRSRNKVYKKDIILTTAFPSGAYVCTALVDNEYVRMSYFFYTKREALDRFWEHVKDLVR